MKLIMVGNKETLTSFKVVQDLIKILESKKYVITNIYLFKLPIFKYMIKVYSIDMEDVDDVVGQVQGHS